ncbi:MAG: AAA family ATPase [Myxococcales bacterium]|nr:AAA family ATPase [Myxococcales bacterium]
MSTKSVLETAQDLSRSGIVPIPVRPKSKIPCESGWTEPKHGTSDLAARFGGPNLNIGVLLGKPSGNLVDIDLDCPEAIELAKSILPDTGWTHGRQSARSSHYCYFAQGCKTRKFVDPIDGTMLLEIRSDGCQTVVPPSRHESGELVEHEGEGVATEVRSELLQDDVSKLAAATIFVRHYPANGDRHNAIMAFSGMLLKGGLPQDEVGWFVTVIAKAAGDEEWEQRKTDVATTAERLAQRQPVTGAPKLAKIIDERVVRSVAKFLGIEWGGGTSPSFESAIPQSDSQKRFDFFQIDDIQLDLSNSYLIKGHIEQESMVLIYGPSGCSKTFIALDMGLHIAAGRDWQGHRVKQGMVVYVAAEGSRGFAKRIEACKKTWLGRTENIPFYILPTTVDLLDPNADTGPLIEAIRKLEDAGVHTCVAIFIDTLSRSMAGGDENSSVDMPLFVKNCDRIKSELGCTVIPIHHTGKNAKRGARGHSSLRAAIDTELEVSVAKNRPGFWINATKQRDMDLMPGISYQLVPVQLGVDDDGDPVSSCVVEFAGDLEATDEVQKQSPAEEHFLGVLNSLDSEPLLTLVIEASDLEMKPNQTGFCRKRVREASLQAQADDGRNDPKLNGQYFRRGLKGLEEQGIVESDKQWIWFPATDDLGTE